MNEKQIFSRAGEKKLAKQVKKIDSFCFSLLFFKWIDSFTTYRTLHCTGDRSLSAYESFSSIFLFSLHFLNTYIECVACVCFHFHVR